MEKIYNIILTYINNHLLIKKITLFIYNYFPYIIMIIYPFTLVYVFLYQKEILLEIILRPMIAFLSVTLFRKIINRPRPYETLNIIPLKGHKKGESFPSRHTLSAFIIAFTCFQVNVYLGLITLLIAFFITLSRFLAGVHYISDILASIVIAFMFYYI